MSHDFVETNGASSIGAVFPLLSALATPRSARWLQQRRWILSPAHHALHHAEPFDRYYCITSGWLNPLLLRIGFFGALERWANAASEAVARRTG